MSFKSNRYILKNEIGRGGMGVVYQAVDRLTGEDVAIKQVVLPSLQPIFGGATLAKTLQNLRLALAHEFRTLASLRHPNIISVLDYGFDEKGQPYFTMTYLNNAQTLLEVGDGLPVAQKVDFIQEMLEAVAYLHRRGILHRDLKPENVLVANGVVRVLDFGLSAAKEEAQESVGTWQYAAPEVLQGEAATEAADLYSVGVLAFQLFANRHPFNIYDSDFLELVFHEPPDFSDLGIDEALTAVIAKLLAKKPEDRYPSAVAAIAAFSEALGLPVPRESASIRESYLQAAEFVGREEELGTLTAVLHEAKDGQGAAWLIGGESGVGKSRLLNELQVQALVDGFLLLRGQGVEQGGRPYQLWFEALRRLILQQELDELTASVLKPIIPDIEQLLGREVPVAPTLNENAARQRLFSAVGQLFQQASQPILLILEDLQWIQESLPLLSYLNRQIAELPVLIVGSYRDDERPNLPNELATMQVMSLSRLNQRDMVTLSTSMLGKAGQQPEVLALLQRETEGNAFFLVEVVRALAEEAGRLSAISDISLPDKLFPQGIETIVARRLTRVPAAARMLLPGAAVLGRYLDLSLLEAVVERSGGIQLDSWLTLCADAAIFDVENGRWQFTHDKLREGILNHLTPPEREEWHRHAAEAIETVYPNAPEQASSLVYHWHAVADANKERHYAHVAGDHARQQFLNAEALRYLSRALELTPAEELAQQYSLRQSREQIFHLQGERGAQQQEIKTLETLAEQMVAVDKENHLGEVALRLASYAEVTADYPTAVSSAQNALQFGETNNDPTQIAASHLALGRVLIRQGKYDEARDHLEQSLATAQASNLPQIEAEGNRFLGVAAIELGRFEQARDLLQKALLLYHRVEDRQGASGVLNNLAIVSYNLGDLSESLYFWEQAQKIYDDIGDREGRGRILTNLSAICIGLGAFETARGYSTQGLQVCREINVRIGECTNLLNLGLVSHYTGDGEAANRYSDEAREVANAIGNAILQGYTLLDSGVILAEQNRLDEAEVHLQEALQLWQNLNQTSRLLETQAELARIAFKRNELEEARQAIEPIMEHLEAEASLGGAARPFQIRFICYEILTAVNDPRATDILTTAHELLQERASRIRDAARRHSFLTRIVSHNAIINAFKNL